MARMWYTVLIVSCALLQYVRAEPRPDFGSKGTIASSGNIAIYADITNVGLLTADDKNGLILRTNYTLFTTVLPLMESLGTKVATLGSPVASAISAAAPVKNKDIATVFNTIYTPLAPYKSFLNTQVPATKTQLIGLVGTDINFLFGDAFPNMYNAVVKMESDLKTFQTNVTNARFTAGQTQVNPNIVLAVQTSVMDWSATTEAVRNTIHTAIDNIKVADTFLDQLYNLSRTLNSDLDIFYTRFRTNQTALGTQLQLLVNAMKARIQTTYTPMLQYLPNHTAALNGTISLFNTPYTKLTGIPAMLSADVLPGYFNKSYSYITEFKQMFNPLDYGSITLVLEVLIASGPNSKTCFNKYYPLVQNAFALLAYGVEVCLNIEVTHTFSIADMFSDMLDQTMYDLDDFYLNFSTCEWSPIPGICQTSMFGAYYSALTTAYAGKVADIEKFLKTEFTASSSRLGSCVQTRKAKNKSTLQNMATDIASCRTKGVAP
uniref:Putative secreted protein n=1 Tax=Anopheles darlingi TaxID=43151 RepID=A0A2M4D0P8_ANODA